MYGYTYLTTNLINGKKYLGQHKGEFDPNYLGSGYQITKAIKKYGKENFSVEILEKAETHAELNEMEKRVIEEMSAVESNEYYNLVPGGWGGDLGPEVAKKISVANSGENNPFYGRRWSEEEKQHFREMSTGKKHTDEEREKMSKALKGKYTGEKASAYGRKMSEESKQKLSASKRGFKHTEEAKKKMSESSKGKKHTDEARANMSKSSKSQWAKRKSEGYISMPETQRINLSNAKKEIAKTDKGREQLLANSKKGADALRGKKRDPASVAKGVETRRRNALKREAAAIQSYAIRSMLLVDASPKKPIIWR